ncbi:MAG: hypothetical protein PHU80_07195 [Kiritimatiellae bacterium]|nr:hypothetical protein [Kiritimatiellia bacterium]
MKLITAAVAALCVVFLLSLSSLAFNPPRETVGGITLSIDGFDGEHKPDHVWIARKVPCAEPLVFNVTLTNNSARTVSGTVRLWLNDDWRMSSAERVAVSAAPGQSVTVECSALANDSVLKALYPVHAFMELELDGETFELHPVAIFEAIPAESTRQVTPKVAKVLDGGLLRLDTSADRRVFASQKNVSAELGVNFSGSDPHSGTHFSRGSATRGGALRQGFSVHPPYRGSPGVTWSDFRLELPDGTPVFLKFHTAIRDNTPAEPPSDGTEHRVFVVGDDGREQQLFSRFSDSKSWLPGSVDLSAYAGQTITLRLWTGPGPKNNSACDQCYWGDPLIVAGSHPAPANAEEWAARERAAVDKARQALARRPGRGTGAFRLDVNGQRFGAAVELGKDGLIDAVTVFTDGTRDIIMRGFECEIDRMPVGVFDNGQPVLAVEAETGWNKWQITHKIAATGGLLQARASIWADKGALRIKWDMPGAVRDSRGTPRYTRLGIGSANQTVWRVYAGLGNVIENPGAFNLSGGGFNLSTRHVGADYTNGLSLLQACDVFPDRLTYAPETRRFALEAHHDTCFMFIPSAKGAFDAARAYRGVHGFKPGKGVKNLLGRMCLDQWSGDYLAAAADLKEAARYGLNNAVFVKHDWQRWGYDYRLPEIYPPRGGLEPFLKMRQAAAEAGMLFCPHDNYIDFYPDAEGYSYDNIVFTEQGAPVKAWYNKGRRAQSYRWLPHAFAPRMEDNMRMMREGFRPDSLFIDVFTAITPFDYYDRAGNFYPHTRTAREWSDAFDRCQKILKHGAPMLSEAGTDALIGSVDGTQSDHFTAARWMKGFDDADRTPWHDMATHGKMILFAGGLGPRYSAKDWDDHGGKQRHGYGSDDYLSNTVMGGRNPMCDGPFSRRSVMTYWLLNDVCDHLSRASFDSHAFGPTIKQQHTAFSGGGKVWANRGSNMVWQVAAGKLLPEYGSYVTTPQAEAGVVLIDGQRVGFAKASGIFFADARPRISNFIRAKVSSATAAGAYKGKGAFDLTFNWQVQAPAPEGYVPFIHVCNEATENKGREGIVFQPSMSMDTSLLKSVGAFTSRASFTMPQNLPAGEYQVRYGMYIPKTGARMRINGLTDGGMRVMGGRIILEKQGEHFTGGSFALETDATEDDRRYGVNVDGRVIDFGPLATDGALRLIHKVRRQWQIIPLPDSSPFNTEIKLEAFGKRNASVVSVTMHEPLDDSAAEPEWRVSQGVLHIKCDARSFSYIVDFR